MRVLHVTPWFYPAHHWGGPIGSLHGLCAALVQLPGVNLKVLTTDSAGPKMSDRLAIPTFPVRYPPGYDVFFSERIAGASVAPGLLLQLHSMIRWADVIHLTSVYSFPTIPTLAACKLAGKPLVWSPRGGFYRWKGQRRQGIKALWLKCCQLLAPSRTVIHCASIKEKAEAEWRIPGVGTAVVPNGVEIPSTGKRFLASSGKRLSLLYLGLISPVKGLDVLIQAMTLLDKEITLDVYGHPPMGYEHYEKFVSQLVGDLGLKERVIFHGFAQNERKTNAFLNADICIVPSHSENFSNVVAEALAYGLPVIASRGTPWSGVVEHDCGEWVDNSPASLAASIVGMRNKPLAEMGARGRDWMQRAFGWDAIATEMHALYARLIKDS
jgi:glycosyltransferase involved in cell wall biosynthesis